MRLWAVNAGHGLFIVRAKTQDNALIVARDHEDGFTNFGVDPSEVTLDDVTLLDPVGPEDVLDSHYG